MMDRICIYTYAELQKAKEEAYTKGVLSGIFVSLIGFVAGSLLGFFLF